MKKKIILASGSPRRKEILQNIDLDFTVVTSEADENSVSAVGIPHELYVQELAMLKASAVAKEINDSIIIGADTVVCLDDLILTKPKDENDAFNMLKALSGKTHKVLTGICVMDSTDMKCVCKTEVSEVVFSELSEDFIRKYIKTGEPMDKAGSYAIQGKGALFVEKILGDYLNIVGLPLKLLADVLKEEFEIDLL